MKILDPAEFIPEGWRALVNGRDVHMFNPGLAESGGRRIVAYRLVLPDGRRRLAICALDAEDRPEPNSVVPLSDLMPEAGAWQADPRLLHVGERLFVHFNNGDRLRPNSIYLAELDPLTLTPISAARPLQHTTTRRLVEKNWMLFSPDQTRILAIYSIHPHVVLELDLGGQGAIDCHEIGQSDWSLPGSRPRGMGEPRGGTTPIKVGPHYFSFFHMVAPAPLRMRLLHRLRYRRGRSLHRYHAGFYGFAAQAPYGPVCFTPRPVVTAPPRRSGGLRLNRDADRVLYPTGALFDGATWTLAAGLHDARCCLIRLDHAAMLHCAEPVE